MSRPSPAFTVGQLVRIHQDPERGIFTVTAVHWSMFQRWCYDLRCDDGTGIDKVFDEFLHKTPLPVLERCPRCNGPAVLFLDSDPVAYCRSSCSTDARRYRKTALAAVQAWNRFAVSARNAGLRSRIATRP